MKTTILFLMLGATASALSDDPFKRCRNKGLREAKRMWRNRSFYKNCNRCWEFRGDCEKVIANECEPDPWDDWWTKMCLKGRAAGITEIMDGVDMQCIGNPKQCLQMGKAVASMVAYEFCPHWKSDGRSPQPPDLQEQCRQVAVDTCEGDIPSKVNYYCGIELTTQELWRLQRKCVKEVNLLVGHEPNLRH